MTDTLLLRLPKKTKEKLRNTAKQRGFTLNALAIQIFWEYFENEKNMVGGEKDETIQIS